MKHFFYSILLFSSLNGLAQDSTFEDAVIDTAVDAAIGGATIGWGYGTFISGLQDPGQKHYLMEPSSIGSSPSRKDIDTALKKASKGVEINIQMKLTFEEARDEYLRKLKAKVSTLSENAKHFRSRNQNEFAVNNEVELERVQKELTAVESDLKNLSPEEFKKKYESHPKFSEPKSVAFSADETQRKNIKNYIAKNIKRGNKVYAVSQNLNLRKATNKIVGGSILLISGISYASVNTSLNVLKVAAADRNLEQERSTENNQSSKTNVASVFGE